MSWDRDSSWRDWIGEWIGQEHLPKVAAHINDGIDELLVFQYNHTCSHPFTDQTIHPESPSPAHTSE